MYMYTYMSTRTQSATDIYRILFPLDAPEEAGVFKSNNFVDGRRSSTRRATDKYIIIKPKKK